jgi:hypothetical protein
MLPEQVRILPDPVIKANGVPQLDNPLQYKLAKHPFTRKTIL